MARVCPGQQLPRCSLSVVIPAYNEEPTVGTILKRVLCLPVDLDVVLVDDGSSDETTPIVEEIAKRDDRVRLVRHSRNKGKGAAIRSAIPHLRGEVVTIQDADLENDPRDLLRMLRFFDQLEVTVVYGSRWLSKDRRYSRGRSRLAAVVLSRLTNRLYGSRLTDEPTCYKMFRRCVLNDITIQTDGFDFCPEVTAKLLLAGHKIEELPISYRPRSVKDGKKIRSIDGITAVFKLLQIKVAYSLATFLKCNTNLVREITSLKRAVPRRLLGALRFDEG